MLNIGAISYSVGAAMFLVFTLLLVTSWRGRLQGGLLALASAVSAIWCAVLAWQAVYGSPSYAIIQGLEVLRNLSWLVLLVSLIGFGKDKPLDLGPGYSLLLLVLGVVCVALFGMTLMDLVGFGAGISSVLAVNVILSGNLVLAVGGLILVEQVFRNTRPEARWAIKFFCFGMAGMYVYEFYLYSNALLFKQIDYDLWGARGAINALIVPMLAVSARRNPEWSVKVFVSRHVVFHTASLLAAGVYLLVMAVAGYYIRSVGGDWGGVMQVIFLFGVVIVLFLMLFSGELRARLKVLLSKHFFANKYDYREEWLDFTTTLSSSADQSNLHKTVISATGSIVGASSGALWLRQSDGNYSGTAYWQCDSLRGADVPADSSLVRFLSEREWIINLDELDENPEPYDGLVLPDWISEVSRPWLIVPLMQQAELLGFMLLNRPEVGTDFTWEDSDLLKTVGRQAASYLAVLGLTTALAEARQFEAFNRLSAYVVHDLKNLTAQLSLVATNAKRHMHNPEFLEDVIDTLGHAVDKMNRLMDQLRKNRDESMPVAPLANKSVALSALLKNVVERRAVDRPRPEWGGSNDDITVVADRDRLSSVIEHLVQNAQEATPATGSVEVALYKDGEEAEIVISDTGSGMDATFIRERLFRPFDTTKGNAGMGIGVYEAREFIRSQGGSIQVTSTPGEGSVFRVRIPLYNSPAESTVATEALSEPVQH